LVSYNFILKRFKNHSILYELIKGMAKMNAITYKVQDYVNRNLIDETKSYYGIVSNIYAKNDQDVCLFYFWVQQKLRFCTMIMTIQLPHPQGPNIKSLKYKSTWNLPKNFLNSKDLFRRIFRRSFRKIFEAWSFLYLNFIGRSSKDF